MSKTKRYFVIVTIVYIAITFFLIYFLHNPIYFGSSHQFVVIHVHTAIALLYIAILIRIFILNVKIKSISQVLIESQNIINAIPDIFIKTNIEGNIIYVNEIGLSMFKMNSIQDILGRNIVSLFAPEDREKIVSNISIMQGEPMGSVEYELILNDSSRIPCEVNSRFLMNNKDIPNGIIFVIRDISTRKKIELSLKKSEEKFRGIVEASPNLIWEILPNGKFVYVSSQCYNILGYTAEELYNMSFFDLIDKDDLQRVSKKFEEDITTRKNINEFEVLAWHGSRKEKIHLEVNTSIITSDLGEIVGLRGTVRDISIRKQYEKDLMESKKRLEMVLKEGRMGFWHTDLVNNKTYVDDTWASILGYKKDEISPSNIRGLSKLFHPDDLPEIISFINSLVNSSLVDSSLVHRILTKQGEVKWVLSTAKAIQDSSNQPTMIIGLMKDINDSKNAELRIREANATKDKLFSIIAHDLKNPFSTILGFSELLKMNLGSYDSKKISEMAQIINSSANNIYSLLENLLEWANSQRGKTLFNPTSLSLEQIIKEEYGNIIYFASQKNVIINLFNINIYVFADCNMLKVILRNLLTNAIKYSNRGDKVDVYAISFNDRVEITISDNGIGMNEEISQNLFNIDKVKSQRGTENETGTGLGLTLCKEFVEKHNGKIWVDSKPNKGSRFTFSLPSK